MSRRESINTADVTRAIARQRRQTYLRLGEDPFEDAKVESATKLDRLESLYQNPAQAGQPDPVIYSLLSGRLLQEFNTDGWLGVPPLVVDILTELRPDALPAGSPGGLLAP